MPGIIPQGNFDVNMQPNSPVPIEGATSAAGAIAARGQQAIGQSVVQAGQAIGQFYDKQQQMQDRIDEEDIADKVRNQAKLSMDKASSTAAPDGSDYVDKFQSDYSQNIDNVYKGYDDLSPEVRARTDAFSKMAYRDASTQAHIQGGIMLEKSNYNRLESLADNSANRVRENPNPVMMDSEVKNFGNMIDEMRSSGSISAENSEKIRGAYYQKVAGQYIDGLAGQGAYGKALNALKANQEDPDLFTEIPPDQARSLGFIDKSAADALEANGENYKVPVMTKGSKVQLTPALAQVMNGLDPRDKANMIDRMRGKALAETATKLSDLNTDITGFERVAMAGSQYSVQDMGALKAKINTVPNLSVEARTRLNDRINTADAFNKQIQLLQDQPRSQWGTVADGLMSKISMAQDHASQFDPKMSSAHEDFGVQADRMEAQQKFQRYMGQIAQAQDKQSAAYVAQTDPRINDLYKATMDGGADSAQKYAASTLAKQSYLGIAPENQRILVDPHSQADILKNMPNGYEASQQVTRLQSQYGPYFPKVMAEITAQDPSLAKYQTLTYASPQARADLGDAIKNEKSINAAFQQQPGYDSNNRALKNTASSMMEPVQKALLNGSSNSARQNMVNSMQDAVELQARRAMLQPGADPQGAIKDAYDKTINSQFTFASGGNSHVMVPRNVGAMHMEDGIVDSFLRSYSTPEGVAELNAMPPSGYKSQDDFNQIVAREGIWATSPTMDGMQLKMRDQETGQMMPVLNKNQKPIEVKFQDLNMNPTQRVRNTQSVGHDFWSSLGDGFGLK